MLRQCTAFFLLLAFVASTFSKAVIVVDFYANQDYIAKNLCENRGKPMMHCCGRCMLRKRLARDANQDKNNPERRADNKQEVLYREDFGLIAAARISILIVRGYPAGQSAGPVDRAIDIFHPPA